MGEMGKLAEAFGEKEKGLVRWSLWALARKRQDERPCEEREKANILDQNII